MSLKYLEVHAVKQGIHESDKLRRKANCKQRAKRIEHDNSDSEGQCITPNVHLASPCGGTSAVGVKWTRQSRHFAG
jgi:hypothetical protein